MAALAERFQGLRRPGASLLKKGLPSRPDEPVITRKAVPPPKEAAAAPAPIPVPIASKFSSQPQQQQQQQAGPPVPDRKGLPSLPTPPAPVSPPPASSLPPTPAASSPASAVTITPGSASSPPSQSATQSIRPPRTTSLKDPQPVPPYSERRPQHRLVAKLQVNNKTNNNLQVNSNQSKRPVSEAPSISHFIPDPEPEPEYDPETEIGRGGRSESENSSDQTTTPTSSTRNSDSNSNGSGVSSGVYGVSSGVYKQYPDGYIPPIPETIIIPPLTGVHYGCFQSHAAMPASSNVWYATACMTCKNVDQEVRHRCTFCCMRICAPCFESLKHCKNRSLTELMAKIDH